MGVFAEVNAEIISQHVPFGLNGLAGLSQPAYYWVRHPEGTRFIAKLENNCWWIHGTQWSVNVTRDQIICPVKQPEN